MGMKTMLQFDESIPARLRVLHTVEDYTRRLEEGEAIAYADTQLALIDPELVGSFSVTAANAGACEVLRWLFTRFPETVCGPHCLAIGGLPSSAETRRDCLVHRASFYGQLGVVRMLVEEYGGGRDLLVQRPRTGGRSQRLSLGECGTRPVLARQGRDAELDGERVPRRVHAHQGRRLRIPGNRPTVGRTGGAGQLAELDGLDPAQLRHRDDDTGEVAGTGCGAEGSVRVPTLGGGAIPLGVARGTGPATHAAHSDYQTEIEEAEVGRVGCFAAGTKLAVEDVLRS